MVAVLIDIDDETVKVSAISVVSLQLETDAWPDTGNREKQILLGARVLAVVFGKLAKLPVVRMVGDADGIIVVGNGKMEGSPLVSRLVWTVYIYH